MSENRDSVADVLARYNVNVKHGPGGMRVDTPSDRIVTRAVDRLANGEALTPEERAQVAEAMQTGIIGKD